MNKLNTIFEALEKSNFNVSTDTRKNLSDSVFFALRGENFDGNEFVHLALEKGAALAVTDNPKNVGKNIVLVPDVLKMLQTIAREYRKKFAIPIIVIGGSNGKTTSKDLIRDVLKTKYKVHSTEGSLNNHFGVPLSILAMPRNTEIGVFEIGANHPLEHTELLNILAPTHVIVTNNGMDHLEGFGSPIGARMANKELYDWASAHSGAAFVNKNHADLMIDSKENTRILYPNKNLEVAKNEFLTVLWNEKEYKTNLVGNYNIENMELALAVGKKFGVEIPDALITICKYVPLSKRSQFITKNNIHFIVDCYNANPTSMQLSLQSFVDSAKNPKGVILGDMLELGEYADAEHIKMVGFVLKQKFDCIIFVGEKFKKALGNKNEKYYWFPDSESAKFWFLTQKFDGFTFLLKGSRGMKIEKILE